ncbi:MAG: hypothetical protein AAF518_10840 [Spirochaetota bacterium]
MQNSAGTSQLTFYYLQTDWEVGVAQQDEFVLYNVADGMSYRMNYEYGTGFKAVFYYPEDTIQTFRLAKNGVILMDRIEVRVVSMPDADPEDTHFLSIYFYSNAKDLRIYEHRFELGVLNRPYLNENFALHFRVDASAAFPLENIVECNVEFKNVSFLYQLEQVGNSRIYEGTYLFPAPRFSPEYRFGLYEAFADTPSAVSGGGEYLAHTVPIEAGDCTVNATTDWKYSVDGFCPVGEAFGELVNC